MTTFVVNSGELFDRGKNPKLSLSPNEILRNRKIRKRYLACLWCGGDIPEENPYAKYCSEDCKKKALGQK